MNIKMLNGKVLVKRDPEEDTMKSPGGILLPNSPSLKKVVKTGVVIASNSEEIKIGDRVYFFEGHASTFDGTDEKLDLIRAEDLIGIIEFVIIL